MDRAKGVTSSKTHAHDCLRTQATQDQQTGRQPSLAKTMGDIIPDQQAVTDSLTNNRSLRSFFSGSPGRRGPSGLVSRFGLCGAGRCGILYREMKWGSRTSTSPFLHVIPFVRALLPALSQDRTREGDQPRSEHEHRAGLGHGHRHGAGGEYLVVAAIRE